MQLGLPDGERKDNGFVFSIVVEPTRIDVHYGVGLGLPALTASELTTLNRSAEDAYQSTHSMDQALLTLVQGFDTVARNNYEPLIFPSPTPETINCASAAFRSVGYFVYVRAGLSGRHLSIVLYVDAPQAGAQWDRINPYGGSGSRGSGFPLGGAGAAVRRRVAAAAVVAPGVAIKKKRRLRDETFPKTDHSNFYDGCHVCRADQLRRCQVGADEYNELVALVQGVQSAASNFQLVTDTQYAKIQAKTQITKDYYDAVSTSGEVWTGNFRSQADAMTNLLKYRDENGQPLDPTKLNLNTLNEKGALPDGLGQGFTLYVNAITQAPPPVPDAGVRLALGDTVDEAMNTIQLGGTDWNDAVKAYNTRPAQIKGEIVARVSAYFGFDLPVTFPYYQGGNAGQPDQNPLATPKP